MTSVLVVDDNDRNRKLALDVLARGGVPDVRCGTAEKGIALAHDHVPDVILMDLQLPDMDGAEATKKLAAHERTARIPVVAMSATPLEGSDDWLEEVGLRRMAREADPREHVPRPGASLRGTRRSDEARDEYRATTPGHRRWPGSAEDRPPRFWR